MGRVGFRMWLRPGCEEAYEQAHAAVGPDVLAAMRSVGFCNYSIFRDGLDLFIYIDVSPEELLEGRRRMAGNPAMQRWRQAMQPLMQTEPDGMPVTRVLAEIFHME